MCGVNDIADAVATRKDKFINEYCEICSLTVK